MSNVSGSLPGYGYIEIAFWQELVEVTQAGDLCPHFIEGVTTISVNGVEVSKEDAGLVIEEMESQAGELTAADFHPDKVKEILDRVQNG